MRRLPTCAASLALVAAPIAVGLGACAGSPGTRRSAGEHSAPAQSTADAAEHQAVLRTVNQLFDGMRKADSAMVRGAFHPAALPFTVGARPGQPAVAIDSLDDFVRAGPEWKIVALGDTRRRERCPAA